MQVCYALQLPQLIFHLRREEVQKFISLIEAVFYVKCMEDVVDVLASSLIRRQFHAPTRCMILRITTSFRPQTLHTRARSTRPQGPAQYFLHTYAGVLIYGRTFGVLLSYRLLRRLSEDAAEV
jgi:hypothetical protein